MHVRRYFASLSLVAASLLLASAPAGSALAEDGSITVEGEAELMAPPTRVELDLNAAGSAELAGDASVKCQDSLRRLEDAFKALKLDNLTIERRSISFGKGGMGGGMAAGMAIAIGPGGGGEAAKPALDLSRAVRIVVTDLDKLEETDLIDTVCRLLDTATDSGASIGGDETNALMTRVYGLGMSSSSAVRFVAENADELREQAYAKAFADAEKRAQRLAKLAKTKLGSVISIDETGKSGDSSGMREVMLAAIVSSGAAPDKDENRLTSDKLGGIPIRVHLQVKFAIQSK